MRPNASVKMRPVGNCFCCATWIATCNRDCQEPAGTCQDAGASYGNSITLPLFATRSEAIGGFGFSPPARLIRCIGIQNNPPKSQVCHAICRHWKPTAQQPAPTADSQGKTDNTPNGPLKQAKPLPRAVRREFTDLDLHNETARATPEQEQPLQNGRQRPPKIGSHRRE
jgi:hypothetical protein